MATTAPGSPYVESSDLVANYPAASEALAERVDTVGVLPFATSTARGTAIPSPTEGQYTYLQDTNATEYWDGSAWVAASVAPGLVHINTTTFSAVSSVSLNDVFTSAYDNYKIVFSPILGSTDDNLNMRLRASGSDITAANYKYVRQYFGATTGTQLDAAANLFHFAYVVTGKTFISSLDVLSPNLAETTGMVNAVGFFANVTGLYLAIASGVYNATTVADGFTILPTSGNITGTIRVYGYKNGA